MQDLTPVYGSVVSNAVKWDGSNIYSKPHFALDGIPIQSSAQCLSN
jgi:hypothetical protein